LKIKWTTLIHRLVLFSIVIGFLGLPSVLGVHDHLGSSYSKYTESIHLSPVEFKKEQEAISLSLTEANSYTMNPGGLKIPTIIKTFEFPLGTDIVDIQVNIGKIQYYSLDKPLETVPLFKEMNGDRTLGVYMDTNQEGSLVYPSLSFDYHTGVGLNQENVRSLFLSVSLYPIRYDQSSQMITQATSIDLDITYQPIDHQADLLENADENDLLIITHDSYESYLDQFISHKERYGFSVHVETVNDISQTYPGRDLAEKIKYCVKHAIEQFDTTFVLLIGDINQLPIRETDAYPWSGNHGNGVLTDLYYADVYDSNLSFCSWDANQNDVFGEVDFERFPYTMNADLDDVDLYADVNIGRIPCSTVDELQIVLNKIMTYETSTYDQTWFQNILLVGGDTFGLSKGSPLNVFEGEITNVKVGQQVPEFNQIRLWASTRNLHPWTFNREISKGVGFVSYAGHGFEHGWGTYHPNAILDGNLIFYFTPYLKYLKNDQKLPIIFFDACLTAKLDFNISDLIDYFGWKARLVNSFIGGYEPGELLNVFAWAFLKLEQGGCVADIGATRSAYTFVDKDGVYAGAGYLDVHFFKAYHEGAMVGEMLTSTQRDYANYVGKDYFTIEEYILLGDPSLRVGGYP
jgi:hypothetical protein